MWVPWQFDCTSFQTLTPSRSLLANFLIGLAEGGDAVFDDPDHLWPVELDHEECHCAGQLSSQNFVCSGFRSQGVRHYRLHAEDPNLAAKCKEAPPRTYYHGEALPCDQSLRARRTFRRAGSLCESKARGKGPILIGRSPR
jgi:hypothetical protein